MIEIPATQFTSFNATTKKDITVSKEMLEETAPASEKRQSPWLKLARFGDERTEKGSLRHDQNVRALTGAEGDYDDEMFSMEFAVERLQEAGIRALLYTSASNTR
jgi:putative DNA primase/helicase